MIIGRVNSEGEPILRTALQRRDGSSYEFDSLVDTGFNHELTLPPEEIAHLGLEFAAPVQATLAGEIRVYVDYYRASIIWDGRPREIAVLEMEGTPLIGMSLLAGRRLVVEAIPGGAVRVESLERE